MNPYDIVREFEYAVAKYTGAPYAVAVDSCTNALMLTCKYLNVNEVILPAKTYVGVAYAVVNVGGKVKFKDYKWQGWYQLLPYRIWDSARRFYKNMFKDIPGVNNSTAYLCLSFHWKKFIPIGQGGMILTNDKEASRILRYMRFDGRIEGIPPKGDVFVEPGYHCYMLPEEAARGLMFMSNIQEHYEDLPEEEYPDLSKSFYYGRAI